MASRVPGTGPVYEPLWFTKPNGVKADADIKRGDIVTTAANQSETVATDEDTLAIKGFAQALESRAGGDANGDTEVQLALAGSAVRMATKTAGLKSGSRVKLDVTSGVQTFELAAAADIAAGRDIATFLHLEASPLSSAIDADGIGVFILG